jgi:hypothetical protein
MRVPMTIRFSNQLVAELIQPFWAAWQAGEFMTDASAVAGTYRNRPVLPKGTDLSVHSSEVLDWVAAELNDRPRKRLAFKKPIEQIGPFLLR